MFEKLKIQPMETNLCLYQMVELWSYFLTRVIPFGHKLYNKTLHETFIARVALLTFDQSRDGTRFGQTPIYISGVVRQLILLRA